MHLELDGLSLANGLPSLAPLLAAELLPDPLPKLLADVFRENVARLGIFARVNNFCRKRLLVVRRFGRLVCGFELGQRHFETGTQLRIGIHTRREIVESLFRCGVTSLRAFWS